MTEHGKIRCQQRGISLDVLHIIMEHGEIHPAYNGSYKLFFGNKEFSNAINRLKNTIKSLERAKGSTIVLNDGYLVTAYKIH